MDIQKLIDQALKPVPRVRSGKFSPSSFGKCFRAQVWNRRDETQSNPPDERTLRVFKCGNLFEEFVTDLITKVADCELQVKTEEDDVLGYADIVSPNEVFDTKSQHSKAFWFMAKWKSDAEVVKEKYPNWLQVMYYTMKLGKEFGSLVFISKDDLCIKQFTQKLDVNWINELNKELATLRNFWTTEELPSALPRCNKRKNPRKNEGWYWMCDYCNWKDKCMEMEGENHPNYKKIKKIVDDGLESVIMEAKHGDWGNRN